MAQPTDFVPGTLDLLILKTISLEPEHGWAYPALHRLGQQAWTMAGCRPADAVPLAKLYSLTRAGRQQLKRESANWVCSSTAINVLVRET
jgi:DNA-binding PadR family transcriptional regulator